MSFDLNNFVIDRVRRGTMFSDASGEALWSITQITDASLSMTGETVDATDAIGTVITQFDRAKSAEFSGSNALWDLGLSAAQFGSQKMVASSSDTIRTPMYEQLLVSSSEVVLSKTPAGAAGSEIKYIYALNGDSTLGTKYALGTTVSATEFSLDVATKTITVPTGVTGYIAVFYEYDASDAIKVENNATEFPSAGKFVLEVIGKDTCDKAATYVAYVVFPNAKLKIDSDMGFQTDSGHPFAMTMMQDYCDLKKNLFNIYIAK